MHTHIVSRVLPDSIAEELQIEPGDVLLCMNGQPVEDVFDYRFFATEEELEILIRKPDGEEWELSVSKEYDDDLGLVFDDGLMDEYRGCRNNCIFCFIDQLPQGMRETLYFKDDDARLSFLQGNYITLTNLSDRDVGRMIRYRMEPVNISVHTMNPELRVKMLRNRFAGESLAKMKRLYEAGITMNAQIVLCKGVNDGAELERSIEELAQMAPVLESVSVVPVGLSKHREGLYPLESFTKEDAREILAMIRKYQEALYSKTGLHLIHPGDEWYLLAEEPLPTADVYDGYLQLENGVGMLRLTEDEIIEALSHMQGDHRKGSCTLVTGRAAYPFICKWLSWIREKFPLVQTKAVAITNHFFGERITVSGLLTGQDIMQQLKDIDLGDRLLLPTNILRSGEDVFLDDMCLEELAKSLQVPIDIVKSSGDDFVKAIISNQEETGDRYE